MHLIWSHFINALYLNDILQGVRLSKTTYLLHYAILRPSNSKWWWQTLMVYDHRMKVATYLWRWVWQSRNGIGVSIIVADKPECLFWQVLLPSSIMIIRWASSRWIHSHHRKVIITCIKHVVLPFTDWIDDV